MNNIEVLMEHKYMQNSLTQALTTLSVYIHNMVKPVSIILSLIGEF